MIIVCEPQCKGISHEKVNSGFLYGLRLAYPEEKIIFFADKNHYKAVENIFKINKVKFNDIQNLPINFDAGKSFSLGGLIQYLFLVKTIFNKCLSLKIKKIFFLSTNPIILYTIKNLKLLSKYKEICCTFVLHGELEDISNKKYKESYSPTFDETLSLSEFVRHPGVLLILLNKVITKPFRIVSSRYLLIFKNKFRTKKMMIWQHSNQYKYISLSPHVTKNAQKYINTKYLNFNTIVLPIIFESKPSKPNNEYVKFAVFGYGDSSQMYKMLSLLSKRKISNPYEIKIISMDSRGTEGFSNIIRMGSGKTLTREDMESATRDVDMFINLYDKTRHKLGCSLSILEAISYLKPVLHLSNDGYDFFNKPDMPIGCKTKNLDDFVNKMCDIIENFDSYKEELKIFRKNMIKYRREYSIENNLDSLRTSFTFKNVINK